MGWGQSPKYFKSARVVGLVAGLFAAGIAVANPVDSDLEKAQALIKSNAKAAVELSEQLRASAQRTGSASDELNALGVLMQALKATGAGDQAIEVGEYALVLARSLEDPARQSEIQRRLGGIYLDRNNYPQAEVHLTEALSLAQDADDDLRRAQAFHQLGRLRRYQVRYEQALRYSDSAAEIFQQLENQAGVAGQMAFRGVVLELMGQFEPALEAQTHALQHAQQTNNLSDTASALYNLGEIHRELGDFDLSLQFLKDALALDLEVGNQTDIAYSHNLVAQGYLEIGQLDLARQHASEAEQLFDSLQAPRDRAWAQTVLARIELAAGNTSTARRLLDAALATAIARESWSLLPVVRMQRVRLEIASGDFEEAEKQALLGIEMTRGNGELDREEELTGLLALAREAAGDLPGTVAAMRRQQALQGDILRADRQQTMAAMQSQAEFLRRGQRIELLEASQALQAERLSREAMTRRVWVWGVVAALVFFGMGFARWNQLRLNRRLAQEVRLRTQELETAYLDVQKASVTDVLTGLRNRRFMDQIDPVSQAGSGELVVVLVDLDHFKAVNDTHGHEAGDGVLKQAAACLQEKLDQSSVLIRWGGEEFLAICGNAGPDVGKVLAEQLRQSIGSNLFHVAGSGALRITASVGFVQAMPGDGVERAVGWHDLLSVADRCMYAAKASGRNAWLGMVANQGQVIHARDLQRRADDDLLNDPRWTLATSLPSAASVCWGDKDSAGTTRGRQGPKS